MLEYFVGKMKFNSPQKRGVKRVFRILSQEDVSAALAG